MTLDNDQLDAQIIFLSQPVNWTFTYWEWRYQMLC